MFGRELTRHGYRIVLADCVIETIVAEPHFASLFRHELRWNRALRACRPYDHVLSVVTHSLPLSAVLVMLPHPSWLGVSLIAAMVGLRIALHLLVRARFPISGHAQPWFVPLRECLTCAVWAVSFFTRKMRWGDRTLVVGSDLTMSAANDGRP